MSYAEDLHKLSPQYYKWNVLSVGTAGSNADVANTIHQALSNTEVNMIGVHPAVDIYFNFSASADVNCNASNDMLLPANTLTFVTVPKGIRGVTHPAGRPITDADGHAVPTNRPALLGVVHFNYLSTTTATGAVRIVEC